jgi:transposase
LAGARLWVLDEMRHGLHGFTRRVWGLPGHRPVADTLPPYSPELNPVEGLWDQLKDSLCNRVFPSLSDQRDVIVSWLQSWWEIPATSVPSSQTGSCFKQTLPPETL